MMWPAKIESAELPEHGRIAVISDIHGNLPYLRALLDKLELTEEDTLVFCGDMVEKGPQSLDTLRFIMDLSKKRRVLAVQGNCDCCRRRSTARRAIRTDTLSAISPRTARAGAPGCSRRCAPKSASH